jgi:carboxymethylenebutenolidase
MAFGARMPPIAQTVLFPASTAPQLGGYLAQPAGDGPFPAVVIIHEIFGLNDNIKNIARRFADQGYIALAVDLFGDRNRMVCMFRFMSGVLLNSLGHGGIRDLKAALSFLAARPGVDSARLGAVGYCMGGSFAVAWACADDRLKVIAPYYGMNPRPFEAVARVCPVVGSYPEQDFTAKAGRALDIALGEHTIPHDIKIYPGAKHSFFNDQRRNYNPEAAQDSWERVLAFFKQHLG